MSTELSKYTRRKVVPLQTEHIVSRDFQLASHSLFGLWEDDRVNLKDISRYALPEGNACDVSESWIKNQKKWTVYSANVVDASKSHCEVSTKDLAEQWQQCMRLMRVIEERPLVKLESDNSRKFYRLAEQWYNETGMISMIHKKAMHPAYQRIIGMGKEALPFIFNELKKGRAHWLWALSAIIDGDAAKPENTLEEAVRAWINWGEANGYA